MEELDKQPKKTPKESAGLAGYAPDERILVLMRDFLGDNQKKAEYKSRVKLLRKFIKNSEDHLGDLRLKEINTDLASLGQKIIREKFLKEQLTILLLPKTDLTTIDKKAIYSGVFSKLSLRELEKYAASSDAARKQVNEYYESLFTQAKLSNIPDKENIFRLIQEHKIKELKLFLTSLSQMNRLSLALFEPAGVFDPLLYLKIHGQHDVLKAIYSFMKVYSEDPDGNIYCAQRIRLIIRTSVDLWESVGFNIRRELSSAPDSAIQAIFALACEYEDHQVVEILCEVRPELMLSAIREGNFARVKELVDHGANPATMPSDETGRQLRMNFYEIAINTDQNEIAQYLIDQSMAEILAKDGNRGRVFAVACAAQNIEMLRYLYNKTKGKPGVENIIKNGSDSLIHNRTALQHACWWGNVEAVGLLLDIGFPVGVVLGMPDETSVLYFACRLAHRATMLDIIKLILAKNSTPAFINAHHAWGDSWGKTVLLLAYASGNRDVIELLLQKDASLDVGLSFDHRSNDSRISIIRQAVSDKNTLKIMPIDLLERYTQKYPKRKTAERLLNILTGVAGESPLTLREKIYLNIALFFNTELGFIYKLSRTFCPPENIASETIPLLDGEGSSRRSDDTESVALESTPEVQPTKTVREQAEWLEEVFGPQPPQEFEDDVAFFDRRTPPPSPPLPRGENLNNDNNTPVDGSKKSPKK